MYVSACAFDASLYTKDRADAAELERYFTQVHSFYLALPPNRFPVLAALTPSMFGHGEEERFDFGIDILIAGMEAASAAERAAALANTGGVRD